MFGLGGVLGDWFFRWRGRIPISNSLGKDFFQNFQEVRLGTAEDDNRSRICSSPRCRIKKAEVGSY